jgi:hypothetical protein
MANNGDFAKVAGRLCIGGTDDGAENFIYFKSDYVRDPRFCLVYGAPSAEVTLTRIASATEELLGSPKSFDIRWLGALHGLVWLAGYALLLRALRPLPRVAQWIAGVAAIWIFADVLYVAYFNSFYTDAAAVVAVMAMIPAALLLLSDESASPGWVVAFSAAALLFVTSKAQHGVTGFLGIGLLLMVAWRLRSWRARLALTLGAAMILAGDVWILAATPTWLRNQARFNLIFWRLLPSSANPSQDAAELGLEPEDLRYVGLHSFLPKNPTLDPAWMLAFTGRAGYSKILQFYLRHPARTMGFLWHDLKEEASQPRAFNLSNYRRQDGYPPGAKSSRFASWSSLRSRLLTGWPWHMVLWYALVLCAAPFLARRERSSFRRAVLWATVFAAATGLAEFFVASLADALETFRHLLLFHLFTDFVVFLAFVYCLDRSFSFFRYARLRGREASLGMDA